MPGVRHQAGEVRDGGVAQSAAQGREVLRNPNRPLIAARALGQSLSGRYGI